MPARTSLPERKPYFAFHAGRLFCEHADIERLAKRFGTPLYLYSSAAVAERFAAYQKAFHKVPHTICYSVKANSNLAILKLMGSRGAGFDIVSGGELERVRAAAPKLLKNVVFSGVGKTAAEIDAALRAGILLFNVESEGELFLLEERARRLRCVARIALRVNPDVSAKTHPYISTGLRKHKFGVSLEAAKRLYAHAMRLPSLWVIGVSVHIGSQIHELSVFQTTLERVATFIGELRAAGVPITHLDIGGGLGIEYVGQGDRDFPARVKRYAETVLKPIRRMGLHLLLEPGRSIVGPAGALVTEVIHTKRNAGKDFVIVDAAMNDLIRPTLYQAHHEIVPVQPRPGRASKVDVVGPICESGDFFARDRKLPLVKPGDFLAIYDTGAYGMSLASNYNSRPRAAEVLVQGTRTRVIRKRETIAELLKNESVL